MEFKGFDEWVEIFRGGVQKDSDGRSHDGDAIIDQAVSTFNSASHEPPAVIGHPRENAPAYGWVEGVKKDARDGKSVLMAKFGQVVPEFAQMVKDGRFKKRSASFYPDGRLRHVGFLGAMPPAVKGLADMRFSGDDGSVVFEFGDRGDSNKNFNQGGFNMEGIKDFIEFLKFWKKEGKELFQDAPATGADAQFSEADVKAREEEARKKAEKETRKKVEAEFAEKGRQNAASKRKEEIASFCDRGVKEGKILPAWTKLGLREFMESLDAEEAVQFSEGDDGKKTGYEWFKGFLQELPKTVEFKEIATRGLEFAQGDEGKAQDEAGRRIAARVNPK